MTSIAHRLYSALGFSSFGQAVGQVIQQPLVNVVPRKRFNSLMAVILFFALLILILNKVIK